MTKPKLSIIILSYNTEKLLDNCIKSLLRVKNEIDFEIIISDNGSTDGSKDLITEKFPYLKFIESQENLGFAKGNNLARSMVKGELVLFLNSDTEVYPKTLQKAVVYIETNSEVGAVTCKLVLPNGELDKDSRRSFPTPWVSFTHFTRLDKIFTHSKLFSRYWYGYLSENVTHEVDVIQGAFLLTRKDILDKVNWFSEDYFLDGEDIDLCWKIKQLGYKLFYYPEVKTLHIKGASKGKVLRAGSKPSPHDRLRFVMAGVESMEIFYRKWLWKKYNPIINISVLLGIQIIKAFRFTKLIFNL